jgi:hypothetical protein
MSIDISTIPFATATYNFAGLINNNGKENIRKIRIASSAVYFRN